MSWDLTPTSPSTPSNHYFIMMPLQLCCWRYEFAWWQYHWCINWHFALLVEVMRLNLFFWGFLFSQPFSWFFLSCDRGSLRCQSVFKSDIWPAQHFDGNIYVFFCCQKFMCLMLRQAGMSPNSSWTTKVGVAGGISRLNSHLRSAGGKIKTILFKLQDLKRGVRVLVCWRLWGHQSGTSTGMRLSLIHEWQPDEAEDAASPITFDRGAGWHPLLSPVTHTHTHPHPPTHTYIYQ